MKKFFSVLFLFLFCFIVVVFLYFNNSKNSSFVNVLNYKNNHLYKDGKGFVYKNDDYIYIVTNYHIISDFDELFVKFSGKKIKAVLLNYDEYDDIAILLIDSKYNNNVVNIGSINNEDVGNKIYFYNIYNNKVTGTILNMTAAIKLFGDCDTKILDLLKLNLKVIDGDSGSALLNSSNEVIGMLTMKSNTISNVAYAIPIDILINKLQILENNYIYRNDLGLLISDNVGYIKGVIIDDILDDNKVGNLNVDRGDIIVQINDDIIEDISEFNYYMFKYSIGDNVNIKYYRNGDYFIDTVVLK